MHYHYHNAFLTKFIFFKQKILSNFYQSQLNHLFYNFFSDSIKMLNLEIKKLKLIAKNRGIEDYKKIPKGKSFNTLKEPKPIKRNKTTKDIRKKILVLNFNDRILRDIRNLYE